ncbi:hypothetical protein D9M71_374500 [compost metagenome]
MLGRFLSLLLLLGASLPAAALTIYKYTDANGVVTYTDKAVAGAQVFVFRDRMIERLDLAVKLETKKHEAGETLLLRNELFAPVEVELRIEQADNVSGVPDRPIRWVLAPRSSMRMATLAPADAARPMRYKPNCVTPWATRACSRCSTAIRCPGRAVRSA